MWPNGQVSDGSRQQAHDLANRWRPPPFAPPKSKPASYRQPFFVATSAGNSLRSLNGEASHKPRSNSHDIVNRAHRLWKIAGVVAACNPVRAITETHNNEPLRSEEHTSELQSLRHL